MVGASTNSVGAIVGIVLVASVVGWFGYKHYQDTREDRLPLKLKQQLTHLQNNLPVEVEPGYFLERFDIKRSSIDFILRINRRIDPNVSTDQIVRNTNLWLCKWRVQFIKTAPVTLYLTLLDAEGSELASVENTPSICARLPANLPSHMTL